MLESRPTILTEGSCGKGNAIDRFDTSGLYATVFIIVSVKLTVVSVMVKNALQIGKDCMEAYEIKLPQGLYTKISNYVVTMDTPMEEGL